MYLMYLNLKIFLSSFFVHSIIITTLQKKKEQSINQQQYIEKLYMLMYFETIYEKKCSNVKHIPQLDLMFAICLKNISDTNSDSNSL